MEKEIVKVSDENKTKVYMAFMQQALDTKNSAKVDKESEIYFLIDSFTRSLAVLMKRENLIEFEQASQ